MRAFILLVCVFGFGYDKPPLNSEEQYKPFHNGTFQLVLAENAADTIFVEARSLTSIPYDGVDSKMISISKKGAYFINLLIDRPNAATVIVNNEVYNVILKPDDTTQVTLLPKDGKVTLQFDGKHSDINRYYVSKKTNLGYDHVRIPLNKILTSLTTYNLLKIKSDSIANTELQHLESYRVHNELPDWFYHYEVSEIKYGAAGYKMLVPLYNKGAKVFNDNLSNNYYNFLKEIKINNEDAFFSGEYFSFLKYYFLHDLPDEKWKHLRGYAKLETLNNHILLKTKTALSTTLRSTYSKHLLSEIIQFVTDSTKIDSLALGYGVSDYRDLLKLKGLKSRSPFKTLNLSVGDQIPEFYATDEMDSAYSIRDFKDNVVYLNFWATWCGPCLGNMEELNSLISQYSKTDRINFINVCIDCDKQRWKMTLQKYKVQGVNLLAEGTWNDVLKSHFNIQGIPHYILVDKGNVLVENKADKAPLIKPKIDKLLSGIKHR